MLLRNIFLYSLRCAQCCCGLKFEFWGYAIMLCLHVNKNMFIVTKMMFSSITILSSQLYIASEHIVWYLGPYPTMFFSLCILDNPNSCALPYWNSTYLFCLVTWTFGVIWTSMAVSKALFNNWNWIVNKPFFGFGYEWICCQTFQWISSSLVVS